MAARAVAAGGVWGRWGSFASWGLGKLGSAAVGFRLCDFEFDFALPGKIEHMLAKPIPAGASREDLAVEDLSHGRILISPHSLAQAGGMLEKGLEANKGFHRQRQLQRLGGEARAEGFYLCDRLNTIFPLARIGFGGTGGDPLFRLKLIQQGREPGGFRRDLFDLWTKFPLGGNPRGWLKK